MEQLKDCLADTIGMPGRYNREKFRLNFWFYFTNMGWVADWELDEHISNAHSIDSSFKNDCQSFRCKCICSFWSSCASGKVIILFLSPAAPHCLCWGYPALSCAEWVARAHLAHCNQNHLGFLSTVWVSGAKVGLIIFGEEGSVDRDGFHHVWKK